MGKIVIVKFVQSLNVFVSTVLLILCLDLDTVFACYEGRRASLISKQNRCHLSDVYTVPNIGFFLALIGMIYFKRVASYSARRKGPFCGAILSFIHVRASAWKSS